MSTTTVKRARVTARIAQAENTSLPTSSQITQQLIEQTEEKRKQLDKKCGDYEQICRRVTKLKGERKRLETDHTQLTFQSDEVDQTFAKLEQSAEASFLSQQQKNNEMNEAVQRWNVLDGKEERLYDDLAHEVEIEKAMSEKCAEVTKIVGNLALESEKDAKDRIQLENAFETDLRTEKTLEQYLTRLIDDVFINQRRLEDIHMGTSRGRADFRQAEKSLRDQKRRHRRLSSQISQTTNENDNVFQTEEEKEEYRQQLEQIENAWDTLQEKIRLKEFELADESEKMNDKIKVLEEQHKTTVGDDEKQKQLKIAKDYADLQSLTPMYAAFTANLNLKHNLMEKLETAKSGSSSADIRQVSNQTSRGTRSSVKSLEFLEDLEQLPEYSEMLDSRKKIIRATENEANRILHFELKELEGVVTGQKQEVSALERDVKWLKENIQLRHADLQFYKTKTEELIEKARKEDEHRLQSDVHKSQNGPPPDMDLRSDVLELTEKRLILENERNMLTNQIKDSSMECDRLNDQWKILKGFAKTINIDGLRAMNEEIEQWRIKVHQLKDQIVKLQRMEDYASLANGQLRTNLALLKPYDEEYQEFENLVEASKRLNDQLARHEFQSKMDELKYNGDIEVLQ